MTVCLFVMKLVRKWNCYNTPSPRMPLRLASLFLLVLGLHYCVGFSLVVMSRSYSLVVMPGLLTAVASLVECGLSCSMACGIFRDQGSNPCIGRFFTTEPPGKSRVGLHNGH